jgi:short-subunit dehydrogenase
MINGNSRNELIWITGASQGIGRALALAYADQGATVIISARNKQKLQELSQEREQAKGHLIALPLDITSQVQVKESVALLIKNYHLPDRVILNAGTHQPFSACEFDSQILQKLLQVNLIGASYLLEELLPLYSNRNKQKKESIKPSKNSESRSEIQQIALVASVAGYRGLPTASAYGASKAAVINLAESLRTELYGSGIDIRLINPGFVKTPLTDKNNFIMPFLISAEEASDKIIKGLDSSRFEIVFPTRMAWAMSLLKWLPDRFFFPLINRSLCHHQK